MNTLVELKGVGIRYMVGDFKGIGLKEFVIRKLTGTYRAKEFWADRGITFALNRGDMLGIIGANGAGKSTLLKAVSGILEPVEGSVRVHGRIAALLELTSGFDKDLTVKENAYLRGAMLGYTRKFMNDAYDKIIDFSGLREFEGRPFRQLSSGMRARLAFSVASMVRPDILILDEVLSVGDVEFRKKSEEKLLEIIHSGVATILVSHSLVQVQKLCNKILWLNHGKQMEFTSDVAGVCERYQAFLHKA
ncbi:MAG: ABC transporter ATP-binding protein [Kiritimatiellae bacterium]|nr:ABC transporter ATP-binding protein [Kiritimatiellia bacterium]